MCERSPYEVRRDLRRDLNALGVPRASEFNLKCFREGHATHMAKCGSTLPAILEAGEWKSAALLKYISETDIDKHRFISTMLVSDDEES